MVTATRPFANNTDVREQGNYFQDLYWWLTFQWNNLIYCCKECNQYKANYFPVKGKRASGKLRSVEGEKRLLLDSCTDDAEYHFKYNKGYLHSETDEGIQTIELINLNRNSLINQRNKAALELRVIIDKVANNIALPNT